MQKTSFKLYQYYGIHGTTGKARSWYWQHACKYLLCSWAGQRQVAPPHNCGLLAGVGCLLAGTLRGSPDLDLVTVGIADIHKLLHLVNLYHWNQWILVNGASKFLSRILSGVPTSIPGALLPYPKEILRRYDGLSQ